MLSDDPMLNCRCDNPSHPVRVVLDTHLRLPLDCRLVQTAHEIPVIVFCHDPDPKKCQHLEDKGVTVLEAPLLGKHISIRECLLILGQRGVDSVLIEGGAQIHASALQAGCADLVQVYLAPKIFGGDGLSPIGAMGITDPAQSILLSPPQITRLREDILLEYTRKE